MTEQNQKIDLITKALVQFQTEVKKVTYNKENPYFKSRYADLANIIETTKPALVNNGLAVTQLVDMTFDGQGNPIGIINTVLAHESGQFISTKTFYPISGKPQDQGSAITYMRRYALSAILGIASEDDDDANAASGKDVTKKETKKPDFNEDNWDKFQAAMKSATTVEQLEKYAKQFAEKYNITNARDLQIKALVASNKTRIEKGQTDV